MASAPFEMQIVTPEGVSFTGRVQSVRLPGADGAFGILARHAPLIAALEVGLALFTDEQGAENVWVVGEGFVEVSRTGTQVLTDFACVSGDIDRVRAELARDRAHERLRSREASCDTARAQAALKRALMRLRINH